MKWISTAFPPSLCVFLNVDLINSTIHYNVFIKQLTDELALFSTVIIIPREHLLAGELHVQCACTKINPEVSPPLCAFYFRWGWRRTRARYGVKRPTFRSQLQYCDGGKQLVLCEVFEGILIFEIEVFKYSFITIMFLF